MKDVLSALYCDPLPLPVALHHEGQPHAYDICVSVYGDVLHKRLAVLHADSGS
jgi:hypothetical protein